MDQIEAMRDTVKLMEQRGHESIHDDAFMARMGLLPDSLKPAHLREMLEVMESGMNRKTPRAASRKPRPVAGWVGRKPL